MGVASSSHSLGDDSHRVLVSEYVLQSIKTLDESWGIYRDEVRLARFLTPSQFDEVFGIVVQDAEPHFQLFEHRHAANAPVVVAAEVFIGICLALPVDIKEKLTFLCRMYLADPSDVYIASHVKVGMYRDFVAAISKVLRVTEPPSTEVISAIESLLRDNNDDSKHVTIKEATEFALTHPAICLCFEEIETLFAGLRDAQLKTAKPSGYDPSFDDSDVLDAPVPPPHAPLWRTKIRDIGRLPCTTQTALELPDDLHAFLALKQLQLRKTDFALVYERGKTTKMGGKVILGVVDCAIFVKCMLTLMPPLEMDMQRLGSYVFNQKKLADMQVLKYESYAVDAGRRFAMLALRDVLRMHNEATESAPGPRAICSDDFAFNLIYRLATRDTYVPMVLSPTHAVDVLGVLSPRDVLRFILEDVSVLGDSAHRPIRDLVFQPLALRRSSSSMLEAFQLLRARNLSGLLLLNDDGKDDAYSTFGWTDILELVENWPPRTDAGVVMPTSISLSTPLPNFGYLLRPIGHVLKVLVV
ncbi:hypothetical protein SPRG_18958 [Saprolegnia parasitica CBS 223.65]|uniref:CBS domain-containing protein n=1 Tax=Saprolegnia parasitica (strain CBS 223.65) TaxID=695850 RepID=A0A067CWJ9_SAPPC|nr:hypothetical protein SPRG_18958 [Saprolegnia parasitica CBS 223.65]KDO35079.1 hypothetical protein SPRG_18958 [Saprolegnia parasitica CBS 223.65]|eukprot:XP_012194825.1 hypothetical protein SPRG_18958 [Saprolegnia parasitica CBS 223.65]